MRLNLAHVMPRSAANGPGERFVLWVQGCPLACPGCWNPGTWTFAPRDVRDTSAVVAGILGTAGIEGVTFTGGEPFAQAPALAEVARAVQAAGLSVFVFTGYEFGELSGTGARTLLSATDVLVTGRFIQRAATPAVPWRGSSNQSVHFLTRRYDAADMQAAPVAEAVIGPDGTVTLTGFPPSGWL